MAKPTPKTKRKNSARRTATAKQSGSVPAVIIDSSDPRAVDEMWIRGLRKKKRQKVQYDDHPLYNIFAWLRQRGKVAMATGDCTQVAPYIERALDFKDLPYKGVRKNPPSKWWCYPTPNSAVMGEKFYRKRDNNFWQLPVVGFWTRDEAVFFISSRGNYSGPVPLLDCRLESADPKPLFEEFCRREDVGLPPESGFFAARSRRLARSLDPQAISCVLSGGFEWNRIINSANGERSHEFEGDRIKNPKELLWDIARETLGAVHEVHPDLSLSCFRGVLQSWQLFDHFCDICCRFMQSDRSLDWQVVDHARDYVWMKLGQFAEHGSAITDTEHRSSAPSPAEPTLTGGPQLGTEATRQEEPSLPAGVPIELAIEQLHGKYAVTYAKAARILGFHLGSISRLVREGKLESKGKGQQKMITVSSLARYKGIPEKTEQN